MIDIDEALNELEHDMRATLGALEQINYAMGLCTMPGSYNEENELTFLAHTLDRLARETSHLASRLQYTEKLLHVIVMEATITASELARLA